MKHLLPIVPLLLTANLLQAQSYDYDRNSGEVTVGGKPVFYVVKTSGTLGYSVRNTGGQELIQVSNGEMDKEGRGDVPGYKFTFAASGNYCSFIPASFGFYPPKLIISTVLRHKLVAADTVTAGSERSFVLGNRGHYIGPAAPQAAVSSNAGTSVAQTPPSATAVRIDGDKVFAGTRLLATFRDDTVGPNETVNVYGTDDVLIAKAVRSMITQSDWSVEFAKDKSGLRLRYYADRRLERIFEFLLAKGYLK